MLPTATVSSQPACSTDFMLLGDLESTKTHTSVLRFQVFPHHLAETNVSVIIFNGILLYLSGRHFYRECTILPGIILLRAFFTGDMLKFRPCVIAQEAILLFSVVSKVSVI